MIEWIGVRERLPIIEEDGVSRMVLVRYLAQYDPRHTPLYNLAQMDNAAEWVCLDGFAIRGVTHWADFNKLEEDSDGVD